MIGIVGNSFCYLCRTSAIMCFCVSEVHLSLWPQKKNNNCLDHTNEHFKLKNMFLKNFYCEYCGQLFKSVRELTRAGLCVRHPDGPVRGKHKLYEGTEKTVYTCKYCGAEARTIDRLTSSFCMHHPAGHNRGRHAPAL